MGHPGVIGGYSTGSVALAAAVAASAWPRSPASARQRGSSYRNKRSLTGHQVTRIIGPVYIYEHKIPYSAIPVQMSCSLQSVPPRSPIERGPPRSREKNEREP